MASVQSREKARKPETPQRPGHVWTTGRKLMGNFLPILFALPTFIWGVWVMYQKAQLLGPGLLILATSPVIGWIFVNFFGLFQNGMMKRVIWDRLREARPKLQSPIVFVGIATPKHSSVLDPHEDVGYLILHPTTIEFFGDHLSISVEKNEIVSIGLRPNIHTALGLGRWVAITGRIGDKPIRLLVEIREKATLLGNMLLSRGLKNRLNTWLRETET